MKIIKKKKKHAFDTYRLRSSPLTSALFDHWCLIAWIAHWIVGTDPVTETRFSLGFVLELSSELMLFSSLVLAGNNLLNFSLVKQLS